MLSKRGEIVVQNRACGVTVRLGEMGAGTGIHRHRDAGQLQSLLESQRISELNMQTSGDSTSVDAGSSGL
jgi:hypothetical protein